MLVLAAPILLVVGCGGGVSPTGSGGSSASATTGAGGESATSSGAGGSDGSGGATSSGTGAGGSGGELGPFACSGATPGFAADVAPIFNGCSGGDTCHALANGFHTPAGSYAYLVGQTSNGCMDGRKRVAPGDPAHSYLVDKLTNHALCSGMPMPGTFGGGAWMPRSTKEIQAIYDWICTGAKND